jgi:tetratricopeptide (TPR) repeat protein
MIRNRSLWACLLLGAAMAVVGCSRLGNQINCQFGGPDTKIAACTALIQAGQDTGESLSRIYGNRGAAYRRKGDHDQAIQDYGEAIRLNPKNAAAYLGRGLSYYNKHDYDHEIQDFGELVSLSPGRASSYYYLGDAYGGRGVANDSKDDSSQAIEDYNEAIQDYSEALHLSPNYASVYYSRGYAYDRRGMERDSRDDYDRAIQDYDEAIRLSPNNGGAYVYRGFAYNHEGDYDRAIQDFKEAIRLNPKYAIAYLGRSAAYVHEGDYDRAIQDLDEAIRLSPKDSNYYEGRGITYLFQSNVAAAIADFETAISGAPSSRTAVSSALLLHLAMKRQGRDDARQLAQVAAAADLSRWPGPVLKLDLGKMTAEQVLAVANNPGDVRQIWHVCAANYFTGEDALFRHQRTTALVRLKAARDGCPKWDVDYLAALAELKGLATPATSSK